MNGRRASCEKQRKRCVAPVDNDSAGMLMMGAQDSMKKASKSTENR